MHAQWYPSAIAMPMDASSSSSWVVDMEEIAIAGDEASRSAETEGARWAAQSIYRVPEWIRGLSSSHAAAYRPQVVSLGPLHHGDPRLAPMEEHKRRAVRHLQLRRPLEGFVAAVEEVAEQLRAAYGPDLGDEWRRGGDGDGDGDEKKKKKKEERFVEVMVTDGCFLLELMMMGNHRGDYLANDPVFGVHGRVYVWPFIQSDMLVLENQLPLLLLQRLLAVLLDVPPTVELDRIINHLVLRFLGRNLQDDVADYVPLGHHPLDIYHTSLVYAKGAYEVRKSQPERSKYEIMPTVMEMHEAGIKFKRSKTDNLFDIHFKRGVLSMPEVIVDDSTECVYLNLMVFERLHVGTGTLVTAYVIFMDNMIDSAKDVSLLGSKGVLRNLLGSDEAAAKLFTGTLSRGAVLGPSRELHKLQWNVKAHCKRQLNRWRANFVHRHCSNPWVIASLIAAFLLLAAGLMQTVYTILPFYGKGIMH